MLHRVTVHDPTQAQLFHSEVNCIFLDKSNRNERARSMPLRAQLLRLADHSVQHKRPGDVYGVLSVHMLVWIILISSAPTLIASMNVNSAMHWRPCNDTWCLDSCRPYVGPLHDLWILKLDDLTYNLPQGRVVQFLIGGLCFRYDVVPAPGVPGAAAEGTPVWRLKVEDESGGRHRFKQICSVSTDKQGRPGANIPALLVGVAQEYVDCRVNRPKTATRYTHALIH